MQTPLDSSHLFDLAFVRDARLSPDGRHVAYAVSRTEGDEELQSIIVRDLATGAERKILSEGNQTAPRWAPCGSRIAFIGNGVLSIWHMADGAVESWRLEGQTVFGAPTWSPDGTSLAAGYASSEPVPGLRRILSRDFRADGLGFLPGRRQAIWLLDLATGSHRILPDARRLSFDPEWSPCGRHILYFATDAAIPFAGYSPALVVADVEGGQTRTLLDEGWYITAARWLADGSAIAIAAAPESDLTIPNPGLWVIAVDGGQPEQRLPDGPGNVGFRIHHDMPAWDLTGDNQIVVADDYAYLTVHIGGATQIWCAALKGALDVEPVVSGECSCIALDRRPEAGLLLAMTDLHTPPDLYLLQPGQKAPTKITALNEHHLAAWPAIDVVPFNVQSTDGLIFDAWFLSPQGATKPLPTVLYIHGGPFAATGHAFRFDFHLLTSRGYGVVMANFRGSGGYGDNFTRAIMGDWGQKGLPDHLATVDEAVSRGLADKDRLGVWGASHGGFATSYIVGHSDRFKAAVAEASVVNFETMYYLSDAPDGLIRDFGGTPREVPDRYRACSPLTYAHRCTTPTLLLHGEDDLRCPIAEAEQFYRSLLDIGCTTELVRIPDCNHLGDSCGPLAARRAQNEALVDWFARFL